MEVDMNRQLLEQLIAFEQYGTLAEVAEHLLITQPTVTRGMRKLEEELEVVLFNRKPNKIELTETGILAVQEAKKLLQAEDDFVQKIQQFNSKNSMLKIASTEPGPRLFLQGFSEEIFDISPDNISISSIEHGLEQLEFDAIISNQEIHSQTLESLYLGREKLAFLVDILTISSDKKSSTFAEMDGVSFILLENIGIWSDIIQKKMPHSKFLYQRNREAFHEILDHTNFPHFGTNLSIDLKTLATQRRQLLPIQDPEANLDFYIVYRIEERDKIISLAKKLQEQWPKFF
jgi:transcriptional regulator, LysR family